MSARRRSPLPLLLTLSILGAASRPPGLGDVTDIRVFDHPTHTRVVVELSRPAHYELGELASPARLYLDIDQTWLEAPLRTARHVNESTALRLVRGGQNTLSRARVVLELDGSDRQHRTFQLQSPFRIVTDIYTDSEARPRVSAADEAFDARPVRRVVLDPGHGGKDPGAVSRRKVREKDVVLRIAREARTRLEKGGLEVFLTRDRDVFVGLEERTRYANSLDADLFISIHANASPNRATHGVETYLLDTRYDRQTARVAARENGTSIDALNDLQRILASLRLGYNERFAARLADDVHGSLLSGLRGRYKNTRDLRVKRGPFMVLFMADMPAILIEVGFLSSRTEAKRMATKKFAQTAAQGIAGGILRYRDEHARSLVAGR